MKHLNTCIVITKEAEIYLERCKRDIDRDALGIYRWKLSRSMIWEIQVEGWSLLRICKLSKIWRIYRLKYLLLQLSIYQIERIYHIWLWCESAIKIEYDFHYIYVESSRRKIVLLEVQWHHRIKDKVANGNVKTFPRSWFSTRSKCEVIRDNK